MTAHLSDEQLAQWMLGDHATDAAQHLAHCDACRMSVEEIDTYLGNCRDAVLSSSDRGQIFWTRQARAIHQRVRERRSTPVLRWAYAATLVLVLCAAFLVARMPHSQPPAVSNSADDVLLQQVENDVAREYPIALAPAALIANERDGALSANGKSSLNQATHKEQDR